MNQIKQKPKKVTKKQQFFTFSVVVLISLIVTGLALCAMFAINQQAERNNAPFTEQPMWVQDFSSSKNTSIDPTVWRYSTNPNIPGYNNEKQAYTSNAQNIRIEPNTGLIIEAHKGKYRYPNDPQSRMFEYTSGRIDTQHSFNFSYGKVEATIMLPKGRGVWPAFWLLSANEPYTSKLDSDNTTRPDERFYMKDGEIDIMEYYGDPGGHVEGTLHTYARSHENRVTVSDYAEKFHTYAVEIEPTKVTWTVDDKPYFTYSKTSKNTDEWPIGSDNQFYIILNLAMGGTGGGEIDDTAAPWQMVVKNVKFYDYVGHNPY
ncbi:MAG: glycoside hydrolase family 16 [Candidatus Saccharibacteria bacterium]|nr:glycoside hydrolase family 16 [Candidatus Saccharibacteria bacterium]